MAVTAPPALSLRVARHHCNTLLVEGGYGTYRDAALNPKTLRGAQRRQSQRDWRRAKQAPRQTCATSWRQTRRRANKITFLPSYIHCAKSPLLMWVGCVS